MSNLRKVDRVILSIEASDGAGVKLRRSIGSELISDLDPFLLLDNFGTENPDDYIAGFPSHPHRGFETVTYMIDGQMRHKDSTGSEGILGPGSVQWMTAGRGIVHSEMPEQREGRMSGFQLWVNLPAKDKMCTPRYQNIDPEDVPVVELDRVKLRVLAGTVDSLDGAVAGPVVGVATDPIYIDVALAPGGSYSHTVPEGHTAFAYVFEGVVDISGQEVNQHHLAILSDGDQVHLSSETGGRAILVAGRPIGEPVARYGPFVMNSFDEIQQAVRDFQTGNF
ncbi:pirin family protein [Sneathiella sp. CAU 1612]|uniref:Pirin family protein n=1 Tax=Sneathiella sedimenti TaxID=2816034 RepID=A0ABS3F6U3_9PROT|nr:pirin family protein [Sneathiella sedimenti]MBO0334089.1 pirin family protein [Sneathiella sedimenti]